MMTFAEFQATREVCADLGTKLQDVHWDDGPPAAGFVYLDALWIEKVPDHWPEEARAAGAFYLQIENLEYFADQLELLECRLYVWACDSGYCDETPKLLAALQDIHEWLTAIREGADLVGVEDMLDKAQSAIAKAKAEPS